MDDRQAGSRRAIYYALGANLGIALAKAAAAFWTGSGSLLAEAIHSGADCGNQLLLLLGMRQARAQDSDDYPLGHHRVVYFWSMIVALMLFFLGGAFSVYEGIDRFLHPGMLRNGFVALLVLSVAVVLEGVSLAGALREIREERGTRPFLRWFRETRRSEMLVVAGEDIAALGGLSIAFVAVLLAELTGEALYDAAGTVLVGVLLMLVAVAVMREVKGLIVGESASPQLRREIGEYLAAQPEIESVLRVITLAWGDAVVVAVKARMRGASRITGEQMIHDINAVEARLQQRFPAAHWVFFEPDVR